jgi:transaldolase
VGEKATLATQREILKLREAGRTETRLIGASMREGSQVASLAGVDVLTIPPKVAAQYAETPGKEVSSQVQKDPPVSLAGGIRLDDFNGTTLWDVPGEFKNCVENLLNKDVDILTPEDLQVHFEDAGFGGFLPRWSDEDLHAVAANGKIPAYERWRDRLSSGHIGMDALINISGLYSFATDQKALDERIKSLI